MFNSTKNKLSLVLLVSIMFIPLLGLSQEPPITVKGSVTSEDGESLPGVNILQKGTQIGTVTDSNGNYTITVQGDVTLVFSFIGYVYQEIAVRNRETIDVVLTADLQTLEEVVVIGYGSQKKIDLTGSVSSVDSKQFQGRNISSLEQGLQGQTAGVQVVQSSGQPGGRSFVRIRGQNSIMGGNDPLYVIDGVPVQSGSDGNTSILSTINPNDIESINVLKDASATAIYGARGGNGVVLITTKKGRKEQSKVTFETSIGASQPVRQLDMLNSSQFVRIANERAINDGQPITFPDEDAASQIHTNWQDEIFRTGLTQNYTLGLSGGNEQTQYFVTGNYFDQEGIVINSGFQRGSFRLNLDQKAGERLSFSSQIFTSRSIANRTSNSVIQSALGMPPINTPYDANGNYTPGDVLLSYPFSDSSGDNPLITANEQLNDLSINRFLGNLRTRYKVTDYLSLELMVGTDQTHNTEDTYASRLVRGVPDGEGSERRTETTYNVVEGLAHYNSNFHDSKHKINATAGFTREMQTSSYISAQSEGFVTDDFLNRNLGAGERFSAPSNGTEEWDLISFLARVNYTFKDKYLFTLSGREDGSSRFGEGNKWAFFPSAAFAWRIANENFMSESSTLSDLKLRLSWGESGNQAISPYQSLQRFTPQTLVIGTSNAVGFAPENLGNPDLKWETTQQINVGVDIGLFDQRVRISLDAYHKRTDNLLAVVNLPPTSGFATTLQNIGSIENRGVELNLGADVIRNDGDFSWALNFNISTNKNEVTKLANGADIIAPNINFVGAAHILREGEPLSSFYGLQEDGLTDAGLIKFVDQNDDGSINALDRVILGDPYAAFTYGLTNSLNYKNFDLNVFIQGAGGKDLFNANKYYLASSFFRGNNNLVDVENRWRPDNPDPNAAYPKASAGANFQWSDRFVEDASYLRVKSIVLGYTKQIEGSAVKSLRFFLSGENLFTITDYSWFDPDVNVFESGDLRLGVDLNTYPIAKTVMFGINIGL